MTPQELAIAQRDFLIRTEKESALVLVAEFESLKSRINEYLTTNLLGTITLAKLYENQFLERILNEIETRLELIKNPFTKIITNGQQKVINFAGQTLNNYLSTSIFEPDLPAIKKLIGRTQTGTTLAQFFDRLKLVAREKAKKTLIEGFAAGDSSAAIAHRLSDVAGIARHRVLTISRTETNEAYRAATREFYRAAEIKEYLWMSVLDVRTCLICWNLHGRKFKSSTKVFSHPNCRCVLIPKTKKDGKTPTGQELFSKLASGVQKQILGNKRFEMFKDGANLDSFVESQTSKELGERYFVRNLSEE